MVIPPSKLIKDTLVLDALRLIKGFRGGVVYGAKIRLPHALVMSFLFGEGP